MSETQVVSPVDVIQHHYGFRLLELVRKEWLTPRMLRVTLGGPALAGFRTEGPDDDVRIFFPADPTDASWAPTVEGAALVFPDDQSKPPSREYTPRRFDATAGELDFDFVIHGDGPATAWATAAERGHLVGVGGPRRSRRVTGQVDWYLLAGDETALPSIGRRLEELPEGMPVIAVLEVGNAEDELPLATRAAVQLHWLHREDVAPDDTGQLARTIAALDLPEGDGYVWAAGEATAIRAVRRHLVQERRIPDERMRVSGYWKRSIANYDHKQPLD
jgi:NADPH-dependent ferric siderophore reductase